MLYRTHTKPTDGQAADTVVELTQSPFAPPGAVPPDEYRGYLRALYRRDPALFYSWARQAHKRDLTLTGPPLLLEVLYDALVKVALTNDWNIAPQPTSAPPGAARTVFAPPDVSLTAAPKPVTANTGTAGTHFANALDTYEPAVP